MALHNVEQTYNLLKKTPTDVVLTPEQASRVWSLFRKRPVNDPGVFKVLDTRAFLQAALVGAIDASNAISFIESLWKSSSSPTATVQDVLKDLLKTSLRKYFRQFRGEKPELYSMVLDVIAFQNSAYFDEIQIWSND